MSTELNTSHGIVEARKDVFVKDLKGVIGDADDLLQAVVGSRPKDSDLLERGWKRDWMP